VAVTFTPVTGGVNTHVITGFDRAKRRLASADFSRPPSRSKLDRGECE